MANRGGSGEGPGGDPGTHTSVQHHMRTAVGLGGKVEIEVRNPHGLKNGLPDEDVSSRDNHFSKVGLLIQLCVHWKAPL